MFVTCATKAPCATLISDDHPRHQPDLGTAAQAPDARVTPWIDEHRLETLYLSAISAAELRAGVALLPAGNAAAVWRKALAKILPLFYQAHTVLRLACPPAYAKLLAKARKAGQAVATADAFIAAIAITYNYRRCHPRHPNVQGRRRAGD